MTNNITFEQVDNAADRVSAVVKTIELQTSLLDFVPGPRNLKEGEILTHYMYLDKALSNIHELNQSLVKDLEEAVVLLQSIAETLEVQDDESN